MALVRARSLMRSILGPFDRDAWYERCKNSSGTSIGVPYRDTSVERKFKSPISTTEGALHHWYRYIDDNVGLYDSITALNSREVLMDYQFVEGSKATTVDKTAEKRRMICIEPTLNMYFQQGLMSYITSRFCKYTGYTLSTLPSEHQLLASRGSIDGSLATIDFSSASDCVSLELLRWILPSGWFSALNDIRCDKMLLDGEYVKLNMISTMGNATTFPLETMVFYVLSQCAIMSTRPSRTLLPEWEDKRVTSVFGDDCILPTEYAGPFMSLCTSLGFIVNSEKSHFDPTDTFRESCGGDFRKGYPVRPYNIKAPTSCKSKSALEPWLYIALNGLQARYTMYWRDPEALYESEVWSVFQDLFRTFNLRLKIVPYDFPDDAGFKTCTVPPGINIMPVRIAQSGLLSFCYCKYQYREKKGRFDELRYNMWLKTPLITEDDPFVDYFIRKKGGYVVARSVTFSSLLT